ncbi:MAG: cobalamin-dependent protein [Candidatus Omnitrophica bacterium]|nr:cobalamin-dependent protein [Candidatus Omnitrophota bacterium]
MAEITLWNSVAKRRRSISDTFYDNGLATLKGYLEDKGHKVEVIDWARDDFYSSLSPWLLSKALRGIYSVMMRSKNKPVKTILGLLSFLLQAILNFIQELLLNKRLTELVRYLKDKKVRILGIKIWYGEAFTNAKNLVAFLQKEAPEIITIAGGYHVTLYEEHLLKSSCFDLGVVCEGEFALETILGVIEGYKEPWDKQKVLEKIIQEAEDGRIENLIYRKDDKIWKTKRKESTVHSSKHIPRYTINSQKVSIHVMVESLGCDWGKCNFCVHPYFYPHYSLRDPDEIVKEIEAMMKTGIGIFRFAGSDTPPAFGAKIAEKIIEKKYKLIFGMGSRAIRGAKNNFEGLVKSYSTLIEAGLRAVFMGGETGNDFINQEVMNKGVFFVDIVETIKALREAERRVGEKVYLSLAFIYPAPLLGKVDLARVKADNLRLLKEAQPDSVMITPPGPFLHTRWYNEKEKFGFTVSEDIIKKAMEYEYVLYKPPSLWPDLGVSLEGKPFKKLLEECNDLRVAVEKELNIPTDISDEHFLMFYGAGIRKKEGILKAKNDTMLDIVSCDYSVTGEISAKINAFSRQLAHGN